MAGNLLADASLTTRRCKGHSGERFPSLVRGTVSEAMKLKGTTGWSRPCEPWSQVQDIAVTCTIDTVFEDDGPDGLMAVVRSKTFSLTR